MKKAENKKETPAVRRASTVEGRQDQMIALAVDLAEKQLREGTASSQVITHYLKLGSTKDRLEKQLLSKRVELAAAKTEAIKSAKRVEELYANALTAFKDVSYSIDD